MNALQAAFDKLLEHMLTIGASDLYLTVGSPAVYRVDGVGHAGKFAATAPDLEGMATSIMNEVQRRTFEKELEMNLVLSRHGARFRVNVFRQRGATGMVVRLVRTEIKPLESLGLPPVLKSVALSTRGLVLLVGGTGSGKSTTLAGMIDHRNAAATGHIVTVEDPIEFVHQHKKCVVTQREIGLDTKSYADALKSALRQAPDVVLIGEIRDAQTMEAALSFAETGHLCLSTLHANNANQALERILTFFSAERLADVRLQLSLNLRAIISQRLVPAIGGGRAAALEIMLDTPRVRDLVKRGDVEAIKDAMDQGSGEGCQTFDSALLELYRAKRISAEDALKVADSANNLRQKMDRLRAGLGAQPSGLRLLPVAAPVSSSRGVPGSGTLKTVRAVSGGTR